MQSSKEDESIPGNIAQKSYPKMSKANWIKEFVSLRLILFIDHLL